MVRSMWLLPALAVGVVVGLASRRLLIVLAAGTLIAVGIRWIRGWLRTERYIEEGMGPW